MIVDRVDPRDAEWEDDSPNYRVYFWSQAFTGSGAQGSGGWKSDEWRLSGASDFSDVYSWAAAEAGGRQIVIYVESKIDDGGIGLVRISGTDPNASLAQT